MVRMADEIADEKRRITDVEGVLMEQFDDRSEVGSLVSSIAPRHICTNLECSKKIRMEPSAPLRVASLHTTNDASGGLYYTDSPGPRSVGRTSLPHCGR